MPNPYFKFKQFTVFHDRCAMKVGTDGVLLGAWANVKDVDSVLDVGAGSGLVSLMLAQRNRLVNIDSIEIDEDASNQANENFENSPFRNISRCLNISLQNFAANPEKKYDLIVSNPPFFTRSLKSPDAQRTAARHTDSLLIEDFIALSSGLLAEKGRVTFIFPSSEKEYLLSLAGQNNMFVTRITDVFPTPTGNSKRVLLEFSKTSRRIELSELVIETERHEYSSNFTKLVKDFYLKL